MTIKEFYRPSKISVILFIVLFAVIFFVPYLKAEHGPSSPDIVMPGRYPLIYIFLISLVVIMDLLSGNFILGDFLLFIGFLLSFCVLYTLTCGTAYLVAKRNETGNSEPATDSNESTTEDSGYRDSSTYVLDLDNKNKSD